MHPPQIIKGDARDLPLDDASVDLIVTSPPYFGLRSYTDGGEHYEGQIGGEVTPAEYVKQLLSATKEMVRVLKPSGSIWVNLGDKYASSGGHGAGATSNQAQFVRYTETVGRLERNRTGYPLKTLIGIPWRYAIRCIDDLGLILRAEVVWSKPTAPESVTDRVRRSHETWFHFTKEPKYFAAVDEIREEQVYAEHHNRYARRGYNNRRGATDETSNNYVNARDEWNGCNPLGKLPGSVWDIPTQPLVVPAELGVNHFAAFPVEFPKRIIKGWSPTGICTTCGEGRRPVIAHQRTFDGQPLDESLYGSGPSSFWKDGRTLNKGVGNWRFGSERSVIGYGCSCPDPTAPTIPATVLDPFGGTGTTALVARALGRVGISLDMSSDYCRLAEWRVNDPGQLATVLELPKPAKQAAGQMEMF